MTSVDVPPGAWRRPRAVDGCGWFSSPLNKFAMLDDWELLYPRRAEVGSEVFVPVRILPMEDPFAEFVFFAVVRVLTDGFELEAVPTPWIDETDFFWLNLSSSVPNEIDEAWFALAEMTGLAGSFQSPPNEKELFPPGGACNFVLGRSINKYKIEMNLKWGKLKFLKTM